MHHSKSQRGGGGDPTFKAKARPAREIIRRVGLYLRPYPGMALGTVACAILSLGFAFVFPRITQYVFDVVIGQHHPDKLAPAVLGLFGAYLLRDLFNSVRIRLNNQLEQNVIYDMRCQIYARLQRLPAIYFDQRASGDLMTRVIEDVNNMERFLIDGTEQGSVAILSILGVLVILFATNPLLAGVALIPLPLLAAGTLWYTLTAHGRYRAQREASSALNALLMDNLQGVRQIKSFGREAHEEQRFAKWADAVREGNMIVMRVWANYSPAMSFAGALGTGLVLWVGGHLVLAGTMKIGELIGFVLYLALFYEPVGRLHSLNQMLQSARASGERVFDILDAPLEGQSAPRTERLRRPVKGEVIYDRVEFGYQPERPVLHQISLHARPGEMVALVGTTGAGKSTLVSLLPAFYEPTAGRITIDGQDVSRLDLGSLREQISVVSQEPFLFNGTLRENILYGRPGATPAELEAAARAANCHDFIQRLPEGYEARVGERGVKLSVGEKQRVSIARALLKDAPILVLDEATASVDTATEQLIQEALEHLMDHRTSFVIAHRLSTIRQADQILVLSHGRIIERGDHESLLAADGVYARLVRVQNTVLQAEAMV